MSRLGDLLGVAVVGAVAQSLPRLVELEAPEAQGTDALLAHGEQAHRLAGLAQRPLLLDRPPDDVGVERAREAAVAGHDDEGDGALLFVLAQQGVLQRLVGVRRQVHHHLDHVDRVRTQRLDAALRATQLGRRDHLHGLGDLARVLDRRDAPADVAQRGHVRLTPPRWPRRSRPVSPARPRRGPPSACRRRSS